jgi:uncharacterized Ntn-hydrolase superfamily protein
MTFSIAARSADARLFGVAIASSSPAVAARCAHARAGAGAVATQNITDPALGVRVLDALGRGAVALEALHEALAATPFGDYRQLLAIGGTGSPAVHSGARALGCVSTALGEHSASAGNLLANSSVPGAMINAFEHAEGHLGYRLLKALRAGLDAGGEAGPVHSAGLMVVREVSWPIVDLRVDWSDEDPVRKLHTIWEIYAPQIDDYVRRAVDPSFAPSFGVPGDL